MSIENNDNFITKWVKVLELKLDDELDYVDTLIIGVDTRYETTMICFNGKTMKYTIRVLEHGHYKEYPIFNFKVVNLTLYTNNTVYMNLDKLYKLDY